MVVSTQECALVPSGVTPTDAAAVGTSGMTAFLSYPTSIVKPGAKVFINGGSGGTGTFGIQIAKLLGAHVTVSCSTTNIELCKRLGADEVIDYKKVDILTALKAKGKVFDLVVDNVGSPADLYERSHEFLKQGTGEFRQVALYPSFSAFGKVASRSFRPAFLGGGRSKYGLVSVKPSTAGFEQLGKWVAEGKVKPVVEKIWKLEEVKEAFVELKKGRTRGKFVVSVGEV